MVKIEKHENHVLVIKGNVVDKIPIDEENSQYQQIKKETKNFTENMIQKTELEILQEAVEQLILDILEGM